MAFCAVRLAYVTYKALTSPIVCASKLAKSPYRITKAKGVGDISDKNDFENVWERSEFVFFWLAGSEGERFGMVSMKCVQAESTEIPFMKNRRMRATHGCVGLCFERGRHMFALSVVKMVSSFA